MNNSQNNKEVSLLNWVISLLLLAIPFVNFILLIVWAFGGSRYPSKRTFAQASILLWLIIPILFFILLVLIGLSPTEFTEQILEQVQQTQTSVQPN